MKPWKFIKRRDNELISFIVRFMDVLAFMLGGYLAFVFRDWPIPVDSSLYQASTIIGSLLVIIVFPVAGVYKTQRGQSWFAQLQKLIISWSSVFVILITIAFLTKTSAHYSRIWIVSWGMISLLLLISFRFVLLKSINFTRKKGLNRKKIIIIGAGELGQSVFNKIRETIWVGIDVIAFLDDKQSLHGSSIDGVKVLGELSEISNIVDNLNPDEVWITLPLDDEQGLKDILHDLRHNTVTMRFVPNVFSLKLINHSISEIAGLPVINLSETPMYGANQLVKFLEDKLLSIFILVLISPLILIISIIIKLSSTGPVLYKQERVSWNGKIFTMLKFRTMPVGVEDETGPVWSKVNETRATRIGAFLRRTSFDELPQLINVIRGDMSIVGPRPERPYFVEKFKDEIPSYMKKHLVKGGITGWAQVNGWRGDTDLQNRIECDLYYIENWSLWLDLKIIIISFYKEVLRIN